MDKINWIASQLTGSDPYLETSRLNIKSLVNNPAPVSKVLKKVTISELLDACTKEEGLNLIERPVFRLAMETYNSGNVTEAVRIFQLMVSNNLLLLSSVAAIGTLLQETVDDPEYRSQVYLSLAELAGYDLILASEVIEAQNK